SRLSLHELLQVGILSELVQVIEAVMPMDEARHLHEREPVRAKGAVGAALGQALGELPGDRKPIEDLQDRAQAGGCGEPVSGRQDLENGRAEVLSGEVEHADHLNADRRFKKPPPISLHPTGENPSHGQTWGFKGLARKSEAYPLIQEAS